MTAVCRDIHGSRRLGWRRYRAEDETLIDPPNLIGLATALCLGRLPPISGSHLGANGHTIVRSLELGGTDFRCVVGVVRMVHGIGGGGTGRLKGGMT
jgi:hypothetical protein